MPIARWAADRDAPARQERRSVGGLLELEDREVVLLVPRHHLRGRLLATGELDADVAARSTTCSAVAMCLFEWKTKPVPRPPSGS